MKKFSYTEYLPTLMEMFDIRSTCKGTWMVAFREESSIGEWGRLAGSEKSQRPNENTLARFNPAYTYPQFLRMSLSEAEVLTIHIFLEEQNLEQEN